MRAPTWLPFLLIVSSACGGGGDDAPIGVDARAIDGPPDGVPNGSCGGLAGAPCRADEYCDYARNGCGATDETGVCTPRPTTCPDLLVAIPTCGCDGVLYGGPCDAYAAGADLSAAGGCPVPAGQFACGYTQCEVRSRYCQREVSDIGDEPDGFACRPLPSCPADPVTCGCLAGEPCGAACNGQGATGLTVTCAGG